VRASESLRPFLFFIGPACGLAALIEYICLRLAACGDPWITAVGAEGLGDYSPTSRLLWICSACSLSP